MMLENEHTALNGTTTTTTTKEKHGYTPLVWGFAFTLTLLLGLVFYAGPPFHSRYGVDGSVGGTPRGAINAAALFGKKNEQDPCTNADKCECASCHSHIELVRTPLLVDKNVCTPPSETVHCPVTASSYCPSAAMIFTGPNVDCTQIIIGVNNDGWACNDIVAHMKMNFVYYNCMDGPSSANGACANKNICEYPNGQSSITNNNKNITSRTKEDDRRIG